MTDASEDKPKFDEALAAAMLRLAQEGNADAIGDILMLYRPLLLKMANQELDAKLRIKEAASDLVQKTLLEAHQNFAKFKSCEPEEFLAWLRQLLRDNMADAARRYRRAKKRQISRERPLASDHVRELIGRLSMRREPGPQSDAIRREDRQRIVDAFEKLDREYRQVLIWRFRDGLEFAEIGAKIDRSPDAARMLCNRALKQLKSILGPTADE